VSARFLGIGLLSLGGLVVGAAGGYLAFKTDVPAPTEVVAAPITTPAADTAAPGADTQPAVGEAPPPVARVESRPLAKPPARTKVNPAVQRATPTSAVQPRVESTSPAITSAPAPPVTQAPSTPVSDPPASTPVPATSETPRYTPEPAVSTPATTDARQAEFDELTVAKHSVIGIRLDAPVSTRTARVEDRVTATVSRDVTVAGRTAIAAGVRLEGTVVTVERGGRFKNRPRLGLQFDRAILADGTRVSLKTDTIYREGDSPTADATAKVGTGAVAGAILGGMIGGKKGAVIGSTVGVAGGVATVMRGDGNEASLTAGAPLTVRLTEDVAILIKR
jgi:hypothetical protein